MRASALTLRNRLRSVAARKAYRRATSGGFTLIALNALGAVAIVALVLLAAFPETFR